MSHKLCGSRGRRLSRFYMLLFSSRRDARIERFERADSYPEAHIWSPGNFGGPSEEGGTVTIRYAIQDSLNLAAVHAITDLTSAADVVKMAQRLGIRSTIPPYPSIALGTAEVSPLDLTSAYSVFANDGVRATPYAIIRVEDRNGKILYQRKPEFDNVLEPKICHEITSALGRRCANRDRPAGPELFSVSRRR